MRLVRCVPCVALILALLCAAFAAQASPGPLTAVSSDGLLALVGTVLFSLLAGYAKGQERRITALEIEQRQQQTQINLMRVDFHKDHPSRPEFADMRESMNGRFDRLERLIEGRLGEGRR